MRYFRRAEVNGWWPGKVVNLMMREEGRAMAQVDFFTMVMLLIMIKMMVMLMMIKTIHNLCLDQVTWYNY